MIRTFIYDEAGNRIGFQCQCATEKGKCLRLFRSANGFKQHVSRTHGIWKQHELAIEQNSQETEVSTQ